MKKSQLPRRLITKHIESIRKKYAIPVARVRFLIRVRRKRMTTRVSRIEIKIIGKPQKFSVV
jgi:hypothetical protein